MMFGMFLIVMFVSRNRKRLGSLAICTPFGCILYWSKRVPTYMGKN